jgi:hypothetical protein
MCSDQNDFAGQFLTSDFNGKIVAEFSAGLEALACDFVTGVAERSLDVLRGSGELLGDKYIPLPDLAGELLHVLTQLVTQRRLDRVEFRQRPAKTSQRHSHHDAPTRREDDEQRGKKQSDPLPGRSSDETHRTQGTAGEKICKARVAQVRHRRNLSLRWRSGSAPLGRRFEPKLGTMAINNRVPSSKLGSSYNSAHASQRCPGSREPPISETQGGKVQLSELNAAKFD